MVTAWRPNVVPAAVVPATNHDEVVRGRPAAHLAQTSLEANARNVMLSASVGTAADLDVQPGDIANQILSIVELFRQQTPQAARLRHRELARFGAGTTRDVGERAGARPGKSGCQQTAIQLGHVGRF